MNLQAIRKACRVLMDDTLEPYLVEDETLTLFINQAEMEAADRADLIVDSTTADTSRIEVSAGQIDYPLNPLVLDVKRVLLPSARKPLKKQGYKALDDSDHQWQEKERTPDGYALNIETNTLQLSCVPVANETMVLTVVRLPLNALVNDNDEPEINSYYHYDLVYWVLNLVYQISDSDIYDVNKAQMYEVKFTNRFGIKKTAKERENQKRSYRRQAKAQFL